MISASCPRLIPDRLPLHVLHADPGRHDMAAGTVLVLVTHTDKLPHWIDNEDGTRTLTVRWVDHFGAFDVGGSRERATTPAGRAITAGEWTADHRAGYVEYQGGRRWAVLDTVGMPRAMFRPAP